jgi:hypothetical protein
MTKTIWIGSDYIDTLYQSTFQDGTKVELSDDDYEYLDACLTIGQKAQDMMENLLKGKGIHG